MIQQILTDTHRAGLVANAVALEFGVDAEDLTRSGSKRGGRTLVMARQIAIYLCRTVFNISAARVARVFNRHHSTVVHACEQIENYREDPRLDRHIQKLEDFLALAPAAT